MKSTQTREAIRDSSRAEKRRRSEADGLTFGSLGSCLSFTFERAEAMQGAQGVFPRTELAPDGSNVYVDVDGGKGGSIDEIHATLQTVRQALGALAASDPQALDFVELHYKGGLSREALGKAKGISATSAGVHLDRGAFFLLGWLSSNGVIRGGSLRESR